MYRVAQCPKNRRKRQVSNSLNEIASRVEYYEQNEELNDKVKKQVFDSTRKPRIEPKKKLVPSAGGKVREYYVAAVEEEWEYAPKDRHLVLGGSLMDNK